MDWLDAADEDEALGKDKKAHIMRIKKRLEKIEEELSTYGIDANKLKDGDEPDDGLLNELNSEDDDNVDEALGSDSDDTNYKKQKAGKVQRMPTMEEKKTQINIRSSKVVNDFTTEDPEELMNKRFSEYLNAIEYLKKNNLSKDNKAIMNILERAETIKKLQKKKKVDLYEIPGEVTPDDILGMSSIDRIKRFQAVTNHVTKTMNELKIIGSNNFKIFNATKNTTAKENYDKSIALFKKQAQLKKDLVDLAKNRWQPLPEFQSVTEIFTDVKKSGEVDASKNDVHIKLTIPEAFQDVGKYYYKFKWMDEEAALKKLKVPNKGEEQDKAFTIDFGHHKKLSSLKVVVKIKLWRCGLFDKTVNTFETNLALLKKGSTIKKNFKFEDHKFYVTVFVDMPMGEEENKNLEEVKIMDVAYTAPPFKSATGGAVEKKSAKTKQNTGGKGGQQPAKGVESKKDVSVPAGISAEEIKDPDIKNNLWSCYYCKIQGEKYQKMIDAALKSKKPVDNAIRVKMLLFQSQQIGIQSAIENEQVSYDQYMEYLNKGLDHDRVLLKYFEDTGNEAKAKIVKFRIECYEKEINGDIEEEEGDDE